MKHTPGPWELNGSAIEVPDRFNAGMTAVIAHIYDERDVALDPDEIRANARLMVTAPELLRTLQSIARMSASGGRTLDDFMRDFGYICDSARAAIAKAEAL